MRPFPTISFAYIKHSKFFKLGAKVALTLTAFWFVLRNMEFSRIDDILRKQDHTLLLVAGFLLLFQMLLGALRWRMVLAALSEHGTASMSLRKAIKIYYIGVFFNNCLPGTVGGDVIRVWLTKSDHVPLPTAIHSVIIDRLMALVALGVIIALTLPFLGQLLGFNGMLLMPALLALGIFGLWLLLRIDNLLSRFQHIPVIRWIQYFIGSLRLMMERPRLTAISVVYSIFNHMVFCLCACVLVYSMNGSLSFLQSITLLPPVILAIMLPVSIGGWGMREASMVTMLGLISMPQATALMLSIELGLLAILTNLPAGLLWLMSRHQPNNAASISTPSTTRGPGRTK